MVLLKLFIEFFKIGAFSFGGGLAALPHIYDMVEKTGWLTMQDVTNMVTLSQITPGPLSCNTATYVGYKVYGVLGSLIATISFMIPAIVFMSIVYKILNKFKNNKKVEFILKILRAAALATMVDGALTISKMAILKNTEEINFSSLFSNLHYKAIVLAIILYILIKKYKVSLVYIMIFSALIGIIFKF